MEITPKNQADAIDAYINQIQLKPRPEEAVEKAARNQGPAADTVVISEGAKRIQQAQSELRTLPDVRAEKVAEIKRQIENGSYKVEPEKIAHNMIRDALMNDLFG